MSASEKPLDWTPVVIAFVIVIVFSMFFYMGLRQGVDKEQFAQKTEIIGLNGQLDVIRLGLEAAKTAREENRKAIQDEIKLQLDEIQQNINQVKSNGQFELQKHQNEAAETLGTYRDAFTSYEADLQNLRQTVDELYREFYELSAHSATNKTARPVIKPPAAYEPLQPLEYQPEQSVKPPVLTPTPSNPDGIKLKEPDKD